MSSARRRALLFLAVVGVLAAALAYSRSREVGPELKPPLMLLTSLPIAFGESLSLNAPKSPMLEALEKHYRVIPIATSSDRELRQGRLLLMIQPFAQPPEDLVALDQWVREGGRLILLADPLLERADARAPDDLTRPPVMFLDTGLLTHWGLRLDSPEAPGLATIELGGEKLPTLSPGTLHGGCKITADRAVARCQIGKGRVVVIADADFLDGGRDRKPGPAVARLIGTIDEINRS